MSFSNAFLEAVNAILESYDIPESEIKSVFEDSINAVIEKKYSDFIDKYDLKCTIKAEFNVHSGDIIYYKKCLVVKNDDDRVRSYNAISIDEARKNKDFANVVEDDEIYIFTPDITLDSKDVSDIRKIFANKLINTSKENEYQKLIKISKDQLLEGKIKQILPHYIIVTVPNQQIDKNAKLGKETEFVISKKQLTLQDIATLSIDGVISFVLDGVIRSNEKIQASGSRTSTSFIKALLKFHNNNIKDDVIQINAIARDPGSRTKIAVSSSDYTIDPVGACIGPNGSRIQPVQSALNGEKIDVVEFNKDLVKFAINAIGKSSNGEGFLNDNDGVTIVVPDEKLASAIGSNGKNVRLASKLVNTSITIISKSENAEKNYKANKEFVNKLESDLNIDANIAALLISYGYPTIYHIAASSEDELVKIEGFTPDIAKELMVRSNKKIDLEIADRKKFLKEKNTSKEFVEFLSNDIYACKLVENEINSIEALADLATDELRTFIPELNEKSASKIILGARENLGWI